MKWNPRAQVLAPPFPGSSLWNTDANYVFARTFLACQTVEIKHLGAGFKRESPMRLEGAQLLYHTSSGRCK